MRVISILLWSLLLAQGLFAKQKLEVFTLQNRDAESLVPVIASALGPEARVTADTRSNSLIVSYPEELGDNLRTIIAQLDQAEPNIGIEVVTVDVTTAWLERAGLTIRSDLSPGDYQSLLPLLVESKEATLVGRQSVVTRNNEPVQIILEVEHNVHRDNHHSVPEIGTVLFATPRIMGEDAIEVRLAHRSPTLGEPRAAGEITTTVTIPSGGAQVFEFNKELSYNQQVNIPIIPIGLQNNTDKSQKRLVFLSAKKLIIK